MTHHKGWHERGYLPHLDVEGALQHVVFRLEGSLPASLIVQLKSQTETADDRRLALDQELDRGHGPVWLSDPVCADIVSDALQRFDGLKYDLLAWCVMPNHVHALIREKAGWPLGEVIKSLKGYTARMTNRHLGRKGSFWAADYFDRYVRDREQYEATITYIEANPVKAGLCAEAKDWRWSSFGARTSTSANASTRADVDVRAPLAVQS